MDIATLGLRVESDSVDKAAGSLGRFTTGATAAERAAKRWGMEAGGAAGNTSDRFQKLDGVMVNAAASTSLMGLAVKGLMAMLGPLALLLLAVQTAMSVWSAGMKAGDIGEVASQVNLTTDALQAYRFEAGQAGIETGQLDAAMMKLTMTMGGALKGGEEQIKLFEKLGVKILDAKGELRSTEAILPELSRGLLALGSETQRNAMLTELFGRSGARMVTMLETWSKGNDKVIDSVRAQGGILDKEVIQAWDDVKDAMVRAGITADVTFAKLGAPIATWALLQFDRILKGINATIGLVASGWNKLGVMADKVLSNTTEDLGKRIETMKAMIDNLEGSTDPLDVARRAGLKKQLQETEAEVAKRGAIPTMPPVVVTAPPPDTGGASNPKPKGAAGTDPYTKIIEQAKSYIEQKRVEAQAVGMTAEAASRLTHETEMLNKVREAGIKASPAQIAQIQSLASEMAKAETAVKTAKFMDTTAQSTEDYLAQQQVERDSLFLSKQAVDELRFAQELLNKAKADGLTLSPEQVQGIKDQAAAMASSKAQTDLMKEAVDGAKDVTKGFLSDVRTGLMQGASLWDAFGQAALNALNKIADKLFSMAIEDLMGAAFGGSKGGGGGLGGLIGGLFGGGGGVSAVGGGFDLGGAMAMPGGFMPGFADGGKPPNGVPYVVGENGPEVRVDGPGRIYNQSQMSKLNGQAAPQITIVVSGDSEWIRAEARDESNRVVATAAPGIVNTAVNRSTAAVVPTMARHEAEEGGDYRG